MNQGRRPSPVLIPGVRIKDFRKVIPVVHVREEAGFQASFWIGLGPAGERKDIGRIEKG
jgi:hypothetical protein